MQIAELYGASGLDNRGNTAHQVTTSKGIDDHPVLVQLRGTKGSHAIMLNECANVTIDGLSMHNVGMFWLIDWAGSGNTVRVLLNVQCYVQYLLWSSLTI